MNRKLLIDILFTIVFVYYGYKYRYLTPSFESKKGLTTPHAKLNEENWKMAHEYGGIICFVIAGFLAVLFAIKNFFIGYGTWFDWLHLAIEILCVLSIPILIEIKLKKDGNNENFEEANAPSPGLRSNKNTVVHKKSKKKK